MAYYEATVDEVRDLIGKAHRAAKTLETMLEGHSATPSAANVAETTIIRNVLLELEEALTPIAAPSIFG